MDSLKAEIAKRKTEDVPSTSSSTINGKNKRNGESNGVTENDEQRLPKKYLRKGDIEQMKRAKEELESDAIHAAKEDQRKKKLFEGAKKACNMLSARYAAMLMFGSI